MLANLRYLTSEKCITGVCGGLTEAYSWSPVAARLIYILPMLILGFIPVLIIHSIISLLVKQG